MTVVVFIVLGLFAGLIIVALAVIFWRRNVFLPDLHKKCVFITGTDSGFGKELALTLDKMGVKVYAGCFTDNGMDVLSKESSSKLKVIKVDVRNEESLLAARKLIERDLSGQQLWGLVNNAGIVMGMLFHLSTLEDYKTVMDVNFFGVVRTTEIFLPLIKKSKGRIVNVISVVRRFPSLLEPYACSKVAVGVYHDGLRRLMKEYGVHVSGIEPGFFPTHMTAKENVCSEVEKSWRKLPEYLKEEYGADFLDAAKSYVGNIFALPYARFNRPKTVSDAMAHGLFGKYPKHSYLCGIDANLIYRYGTYLPDTLMDIIIGFYQSQCNRILRLNLKKNRTIQ